MEAEAVPEAVVGSNIVNIVVGLAGVSVAMMFTESEPEPQPPTKVRHRLRRKTSMAEAECRDRAIDEERAAVNWRGETAILTRIHRGVAEEGLIPGFLNTQLGDEAEKKLDKDARRAAAVARCGV